MKRRTLTRARAFVILASLGTAAASAVGACGDDLPSDTTSTTTGDATTSSSSSSGTGGSGTGGAGGAADCYKNPMTHVEIINACTDAQKIDVMPVLPLLQSDGGLPPLP
jgi:hypothetical protein